MLDDTTDIHVVWSYADMNKGHTEQITHLRFSWRKFMMLTARQIVMICHDVEYPMSENPFTGGQVTSFNVIGVLTGDIQSWSINRSR